MERLVFKTTATANLYIFFYLGVLKSVLFLRKERQGERKSLRVFTKSGKSTYTKGRREREEEEELEQQQQQMDPKEDRCPLM